MSSTSLVPITHTVEVGKAGYTISPDIVLAEVGDYIEYQFFPTNHSIVQAAYEYPCVPYGLVNTRPGFFSGFRPVDAVLEDPPTFTVRVNDTDPFFVYCSGPWACIDHGMVAVVNPNANTSLEHQRQLALQSDFVLQPGDKWPGEGRPTTSATFTATVTTSLTSSSTTSSVIAAPTETYVASTPTPTPSSSSSHGLSTGAIAGIAVGGSAILLLAAIALWLCGRRSNRDRNHDANRGWYLGRSNKQPGFESGATTPAMVPPAYNPHGVPVMTQAKGYPNAMPTTSVVEHYNFSPGHSPPPQNIPNYHQQPLQHQPMDVAAYSQNYGYPIVPGPGSPGYPPTHGDVVQYRPEIYSGTPAPRLQEAVLSSTGMRNSTAPSGERTSMSLSGHSRMGSPDHLAEMNAARSQAGTMNQGGGGFLLQPAPVRAIGSSETHVDKFDA